MRDVQDPVTVATPEAITHESVTTHPAFAQIRANRGSGSSSLYGSGFPAQSSIRIEISRSELLRSLSNDQHSERESVVCVELSEAQWATFVSTLNNGSGVPCTMRSYRDRDGYHLVPGLPDPPDVSRQFAEEMTETLHEIQAALGKLANDPRLPAWARKDIGIQAHRITGSTGFVAEQFAEHVEKTVADAKIEIHAYATGTLSRKGLDAIAAGAVPQLPGPEGKK